MAWIDGLRSGKPMGTPKVSIDNLGCVFVPRVANGALAWSCNTGTVEARYRPPACRSGHVAPRPTRRSVPARSRSMLSAWATQTRAAPTAATRNRAVPATLHDFTANDVTWAAPSRTGGLAVSYDVQIRIDGGRALQPVIYALVVEQITGAPVVESRLSFCTSAGGYTTVPADLGPEGRRSGIEALEIVDRAVEHGQLMAAPASGACTWCDFRAVCGPNEAPSSTSTRCPTFVNRRPGIGR